MFTSTLVKGRAVGNNRPVKSLSGGLLFPREHQGIAKVVYCVPVHSSRQSSICAVLIAVDGELAVATDKWFWLWAVCRCSKRQCEMRGDGRSRGVLLTAIKNYAAAILPTFISCSKCRDRARSKANCMASQVSGVEPNAFDRR